MQSDADQHEYMERFMWPDDAREDGRHPSELEHCTCGVGNRAANQRHEWFEADRTIQDGR
jgi:hypothetical protein